MNNKVPTLRLDLWFFLMSMLRPDELMKDISEGLTKPLSLLLSLTAVSRMNFLFPESCSSSVRLHLDWGNTKSHSVISNTSKTVFAHSTFLRLACDSDSTEL